MHTDARIIDNNSLIEGDICIIGAGPAGIGIAMDWLNYSKKVILLEGGGLNYEVGMQDLYKPVSYFGDDMVPYEYSRLHYFGGTTGHWGGYCSPYDEVDFEKREYINDSGWPISRKELNPYYDKATTLFELQSKKFNLDYWQQKDKSFIKLPLDNDVIFNKMWQFSPPTRFGTKYKETLFKSKKIHLFTYANVVNISTNENSSNVQQVTITNHEGKTHVVKAKYFILACGAVQNARLLLASNRQNFKGLGNSNDLVGRYFNQHIEMKISELWLNKPLPLDLYLFEGYPNTKARAELNITSKIQSEYEILNSTTYLVPLIYDRSIMEKYKDRKKCGNQKMEKSTFSKIRNRFLKLKEKELYNIEKAYSLFTRLEQVPNAANRITLNTEKDALDMPRININWEFSKFEKDCLLKIHKIIGKHMGKHDIGRLKLMENLQNNDDKSWLSNSFGGWHHMGTTRMSVNPKKGVVDANCKIHGLNNLFIAGSSCFPTGGAANPTFTIVALSLRLSEYIKKLV